MYVTLYWESRCKLGLQVKWLHWIFLILSSHIWYIILYKICHNVIITSISVAHIFEEAHDPSKGVEFLTATRADWSGVFEGHINWHLLLYYLGKHTHWRRPPSKTTVHNDSRTTVYSFVYTRPLFWIRMYNILSYSKIKVWYKQCLHVNHYPAISRGDRYKLTFYNIIVTFLITF